MTSPLFRKEAQEHQKENFFGEVLLIQPLSTTILMWVSIAVSFLILLFICLGTYTPKETVNGYLVPDEAMTKFYAPVASVITELKVHEGDEVNENDLLLIGSTARSQVEGQDLDSQLLNELTVSVRALEAKRLNEETFYASDLIKTKEQIASLAAEVEQLNKQIATLGERVTLSKKREANAKILLADGNLSEMAYNQEYESRLAIQQQYEELERQKILRQSALSSAEQDFKSLPAQYSSRFSDMDSMASDLKQKQAEILARRDYAIRSPIRGRVTAVQVLNGQNVVANQLLMAIVPVGAKYHAELFLPTRAMGFVNEGQKVRVRYDAFPHEKFGIYDGTIKDVSKTILMPQELPIPVSLNEPVYRVIVALDDQEIKAYGSPISLQPGMALDADIMLEKRTLIEWLLAPIYNFKGRL